MDFSEMLLEFLRLLLGTVIYRPYVYVFFLCFLCFAIYHLRIRGTLIYLVSSYVLAFLCEFSSTRNGFPFGPYVYIDTARVRELWISNIPFWDSLSFVFLSYFSWILASCLNSPHCPDQGLFKKSTALLGGFLMMLLDVVIDPLTLLGDRWFLGRIYYYPHGGSYFGVTLSNFAGWFFLGTLTLLLFQKFSQNSRIYSLSFRSISHRMKWGTFAVYSGVFLFNLGLTAWIGEWFLFVVSSTIVSLTLGLSAYSLSQNRFTLNSFSKRQLS